MINTQGLIALVGDAPHAWTMVNALRKRFGPDSVAVRGRSMWRYRELLPVDGVEILGHEVGYTPLVNAVLGGRR